jgi:hypothetical protein
MDTFNAKISKSLPLQPINILHHMLISRQDFPSRDYPLKLKNTLGLNWGITGPSLFFTPKASKSLQLTQQATLQD